MDTLATTAIESEREGKVTKRKYQEAVLSDFETGEQPAKRSILASTVRHSLQLEKSSSLAICVARQVAYILRGRVPGTPAAALKQMCNQIANAVDLMRHPVHNMTDVISLEQSIAMVMRGLGYATWISKCDYLLVGMFRSLAMRFFGLRLQVLSHCLRHAPPTRDQQLLIDALTVDPELQHYNTRAIALQSTLGLKCATLFTVCVISKTELMLESNIDEIPMSFAVEMMDIVSMHKMDMNRILCGYMKAKDQVCGIPISGTDIRFVPRVYCDALHLLPIPFNTADIEVGVLVRDEEKRAEDAYGCFLEMHNLELRNATEISEKKIARAMKGVLLSPLSISYD